MVTKLLGCEFVSPESVMIMGQRYEMSMFVCTVTVMVLLTHGKLVLSYMYIRGGSMKLCVGTLWFVTLTFWPATNANLRTYKGAALLSFTP